MRTPIDYRFFHEKGSKPTKDQFGMGFVNQWWKVDEKDLPNAVLGQVATIIQNDRPRIDNYNNYAKLYGNHSTMSWNGYSISKINTAQNTVRDRIAFNVVQSCIDTLVSKISKSKPKPFFLTNKGNSKQQRKAKKLDQFCTGVFYENNAYNLGAETLRNACALGEGLVHVFSDKGRVKYEKVLPYEILIDYLEAHYGPQAAKTMHRIKNFDRDTLITVFPKFKDQIMQITSTNDLLTGVTRSVSDTITVVESWRLPSGPGEDDGLHCIVAPGITFISEKYSKPFFPFAMFRYSPRIYGYWAQSLTEQVLPIQIEINRILMTMQRSYTLAGSFKVLVKAGSKIVKSHIDNTIGAIIEYAGENPPAYITPPVIPPEMYQHLERLKQYAYEQTGISQLSAASQKPQGLNSGKALREMNDIESDRFQTIGQAYENFYLDLAKLTVSVARDIFEEEGSFSVNVPGKKFIETIDWKDVNMEDDEFVMQVFPVSKLPSDPSGRLEDIQEMMQAGLIDPATGKRLLDFPDLEAEENLGNAMLDYIHSVLDKIVDSGEYTTPDPVLDPLQARKLAMEYYLVGLRDNLDPKRLALLNNFMVQLTSLQQQAAAAMPQQQMTPQANPTPTPTSNLVPNEQGLMAA